MLATFSVATISGKGGTPSQEAVMVARIANRDIRSTLGSNLTLLIDKTQLDHWVDRKVQLRVAFGQATRREVPECDFWRPQLLQKPMS